MLHNLWFGRIVNLNEIFYFRLRLFINGLIRKSNITTVSHVDYFWFEKLFS